MARVSRTNRISTATVSMAAIVALCVLCFSTAAGAGTACSGILTEQQRLGFVSMFDPPYSPKLTHTAGPVSEANMSKVLSKEDIQRLKNTPQVAVSGTLSSKHADLLKGWLNQNADAELPGWIATSAAIVVPAAWVGVTADVLIQLTNAKGSAGRKRAANIAGTVSQGGLVGITEQVANDSAGNPKFVWTYVYNATLNGQLVTTPVSVCSADVVIR